MLRRTLPFAIAFLSAGSLLAQVPMAAEAEAPLIGLHANRTSYQLNIGTTFAGGLGSAMHISPRVTHQLGKRFFVFGGMTYMRTFVNTAYNAPRNEGSTTADALGNRFAISNNYLIYGGGTYLVNPRLALTGTAWKDMSPTVNPYAGFGNMGQGMSMRADYRLTENLTVSGGVRMARGVGYAPLYGPGFGF
ncbi:hypothetical protein MUN82_02590 [Hymenobacter aerilatus]|uniref:Outer membrane protein beta-barrel domain-containing protein n=1 Tax=Hymenobacter aerilatus TaxID=2932251 RepID=A0A8T9T0I4_9BACT|nr:hypothetical protein [Hymenobacter aerilatus]UOR06000.1 hypothetical protein MUN82_02590 [Hymenobacter aerilatus]